MTEKSKVMRGDLLTGGKTKRIWRALDLLGNWLSMVIVESKDDITAGDGEKHDVIKDKAELSTLTTCNVFSLLKQCGLPVAFEDRLSSVEFLAPALEMIPLEVVARRVATGSCLQRNQSIPDGMVFPHIITEFYLKTHGCEFNGHKFPDSLGDEASYEDKALWHLVQADRVKKLKKDPEYKGPSFDDPYMKVIGDKVELYNAHLPLVAQKPFLTIPLSEVFPKGNWAEVLETTARLNTHAFLVVEKAWKILGYDLLDWKIEFGWFDGKIYIGDVIDADSWRVMKDGKKLSKQAYRDNEGLTVMEKVLRRTATLTGLFRIPDQTLVVWSGSPTDKTTVFEETFAKLTEVNFDGKLPPHPLTKCPGVSIARVVNSGHKKPMQSAFMLQDIEFGCKGLGTSQSLPDPVIVTNVGMSNGLGPTCAANSMVPIISTVPDMVDVNSSLRTPSEVPLMVVTDPKLAVLAALKILAGRNPALYALLRLKQEERAINAIPLE